MNKNGFFTQHWSRKRMENRKLQEQGRCVIDIVRTGTGVRLNVVSPYHEDFAIGARELLGRWRQKTSVWTFDTRTYKPLLALANRVYGADNVTVAGFKGHIENGGN